MKSSVNQLLGIALGVALAGCGAETAAPTSVDDPTENARIKGEDGKAEAWSSSDNPSLFSSSLEYKLDVLPMMGQALNVPWAASYWPVYKDSINDKWDGPNSDSPAKKYEKAYGLSGVEDAVSLYHGIDNNSSRKACTQDSECDSKIGEACAKRFGRTSGRCIPTWWGICHAWAPASILLPEPKNTVTENGVTFKVNDLKALVTLVHNRTTSKFISLRCNRNAGNNEITYDAYGRPADSNRECRDTNAGTLHVILTNYLGIKKQSLVEDRTWDYEVWNQPLRGYRVTQMKEVSAQEANRLIGVTNVGGTTVTKSGTVAKGVWAHQGSFAIAAGQTVKAVMTGTNDADLYVKFGSQPAEASYDCRPYGGSSSENCELTAPAGTTLVFVSVNGYADSSTFNLTITVGGSTPTTYQFNANAKKFYQVKTEVDYISESPATTDGNLASVIDQYTNTDYYDYLLEVDGNGKIVGGEYTGDSRQQHPDFLWMPTGVSGSSVAGGKIAYAKVKALLDKSVAPQGGGGGEKTVTQSGTIAKGAWLHYGPFNVGAGKTLTAAMTGTSDADLYVRKAMQPTTSQYDCRPYTSNSNESCASTGPAAVYVSVQGYATSSTFQLTIKYTE